jgi:hypothetical protein
VSQKLSTRLRAKFPEAMLVHRDLAKHKLPHLDDGTVKAISSKDPAEVQAHNESVRLSNVLIGELLGYTVSAHVVIAQHECRRHRKDAACMPVNPWPRWRRSCGLSDQSHFTRLFHRFVGESPGA